MKRIVMVTVALASLMAAGATNARAQRQGTTFRGYFTPFVGISAGGSVDSPVPTLGASVAVNDDTGWGAELDGAYANDNNAQNREADFTSIMVNANFTRPNGRLRPYVTGGLGLLSLHGCLSTAPGDHGQRFRVERRRGRLLPVERQGGLSRRCAVRVGARRPSEPSRQLRVLARVVRLYVHVGHTAVVMVRA